MKEYFSLKLLATFFVVLACFIKEANSQDLDDFFICTKLELVGFPEKVFLNSKPVVQLQLINCSNSRDLTIPRLLRWNYLSREPYDFEFCYRLKKCNEDGCELIQDDRVDDIGFQEGGYLNLEPAESHTFNFRLFSKVYNLSEIGRYRIELAIRFRLPDGGYYIHKIEKRFEVVN